MIRTAILLLAMTGAAMAQPACQRPDIPPKLDQARLICAETRPQTPELTAALAGCSKVWEEYNRLMLPYEQCRQGQGAANMKDLIDDALKSVPR